MNGEHEQRIDRDRAVNLIASLTLVVTIVVLILAAASVPLLLDTRGVSNEVADGTASQACRAQFRTDIDSAMAEVIAAKSRLDLIVSEGWEAFALGTTSGIEQLVERAIAARLGVQQSLTVMEEAVAAAQAAAQMSIDQPDEFLASCETVR